MLNSFKDKSKAISTTDTMYFNYDSRLNDINYLFFEFSN